MNDESIFVQIASYRDPELVPTILDMFETATNPENLKICICWQHDDVENLDVISGHPNIHIIDIPYQQSKGACWARNLIQRHYNGERYTLQLDSHHRFVQGWDSILKEMYSQCVDMGSKKPVITTYVPSFDPFEQKENYETTPWRIDFNKFTTEGSLIFMPNPITDHDKLIRPIPARFYSAHFAFADGSFCEDVQHDPEYYFYGEEISISVRAFTNGYDLYHPHKVVAWHEYTRSARVKHWDDHDLNKNLSVGVDKSWWDRDADSHCRNRVLFGMEDNLSVVIRDKYNMGTVRTISEYERYAGINFKNRTVSIYTLSGKPAPTPYNQNYVCGLNPDPSEVISVNKTIDIKPETFRDVRIEYITVEVYNTDNNLIITKSFDKMFIDMITNCIDPIRLTINFEVITTSEYYCKLYTFDTFDRKLTITKINI